MENNSIKCNLTKDDIISDIRMCLSADINHEYLYVIVEGEDDTNFLKSRFCNRVFLYESYDGKNGVNEIVNNVFSSKQQVIGIRDKDYELSDNGRKIFYYDYCCMEMMFVNCNETFNCVYNEFYKGSYSADELRTYILNELKYISLIRKCNEQNNWGIILKALSINNIFDNRYSKINNNKVVQKLNEVSSGFFTDEILDTLQEIYSQEYDMVALLNITQGHDFTTLFALLCNLLKNRGVSYKHIESSFRCSFRNSDFANTSLYISLKKYELQLGETYLCA